MTSTTTEEFNYFCIFSYDLQNFHIHKRASFVVGSIYPFLNEIYVGMFDVMNEVDVFAQSRRSTHKLKQFSMLSQRNAVAPILEGWIKIVTFNKAIYMHTINKISLT